MPIPMLAMAAIGVTTQIVGGIISGGAAKKRARAAAAEQARLQAELTRLENSRQSIVNPYADMKDVSYLAKDLSGTLTNAYANLPERVLVVLQHWLKQHLKPSKVYLLI